MAWIPPQQHRAHVQEGRTQITSGVGLPISFQPSSLLVSTTQLHETNIDEIETRPFKINWIHAVTWFTLVTFAFSPLAPGNLGSNDDSIMLQAIIANPLHPDAVNSLFCFVFNLFGPMPIVLALLLVPQQTPGKLSAGPFLIACSGIGYFAIGIYMALRSIPNSLQTSGWFARNIAENKLISWALVAFCFFVYIPLPKALATDASGFVDLLSSSRFAAVSLLDLTILFAVTTKAVADDYRLRIEDSSSTATAVAFGTALVPYLGASLYCALRPSLPEEK